jgi:hypothetical protein
VLLLLFYYCEAVSEQCAARCVVATGALLERGLPRDVEPLLPRALFGVASVRYLDSTHIDAELSWRPPPVHTHSTQHQHSARTHAAALQTHAWKPERNPQRLAEQLVRVFVQRACLCTGACGALAALVGRREGAPVGVSGVAKE